MIEKKPPRIGPLWVVLFVFVLALAWLTVMRGALLAMHWPRFAEVADIWRVFPIGLRMDVIVICELLAAPTILFLLLPGKVFRRRIALVMFTLTVALLVHMELTTPAFIAEYDSRPNRIYFEYLRYPQEVLGTLWKSFPLQLLAVAAALITLTIWFYRALSRQIVFADTWSWRTRAACFPVVLVLLFIGARSSFDHRPANLSTASFSHDHLANELAVSSTYTLLNAIYMDLQETSTAMYGHMEWADVQRRVASYGAHPETASPTTLKPLPASADRRPNVVIFVLESLGAGFVGVLDGLPLTPNFDRLASDGLLFTQLYATGTRTVRGLEAIVAGFPPTSAQSVLKRPQSQDGFFTLASLLQQEGYRTDFIYGGASHFDNMGRFLKQNGFDRVIDQKDFTDPVFAGTWGVSDEDLVTKAHATFVEHGEQPFFALMLSTSNHDPFEFPSGRIELYDTPAATRNNAVKYSDYAIGKLLALAQSAPYGRNTLFLIVADHDARVFGADLVPIDHFRIPGLLIGPGVPKRHEKRVMSQIDLAPTLLGLMGVATTHPMIGRDMLALGAETPGRAMMQYADTNAFRVGDRVAIHQPHQRARTFTYEAGRLIPRSSDRALEQDALAHLLWAETTYRERRYRLSPQ